MGSEIVHDQFDYVIVGAGSSGCVVASRLTEDPEVSVLLLEAGGLDSQFYLRMGLGFHAFRYPEVNWGYQSEPEPQLLGRRLLLPRGKVLGGSSTINGMLYSRGHPDDYDQWEELGCQGWSHKDVLPYFRRSETNWRGETEHHGGSGPLQVSPMSGLLHEPVLEAAVRLGYPVTTDHHGDLPEGFGVGDATIDRRGRRSSASRAYLKPARPRPNLTVRTGAHVLRVLLEDRHATGVEYEHDGIHKTTRSTREVVLAGGVYNSPMVLMHSGIGPAGHLKELGIHPVLDLPGVGQNLSEHAGYYTEHATNDEITLLRQLRVDRLAVSAVQWAVTGKGLLASQTNSCHAELRTRPDLRQPDVQIYFNPVRIDAKPWLPLARERQDHRLSSVVCLLHPASRGHLRLKSADPREAPAITLNLMSEPEDVSTLVRSVAIIREIYGTEPLAGLVSREILPGHDVQGTEAVEQWLRENLIVTHHAVGTCSMGNDASAVVDPELRVRGISGLRICDASVMPTVPGGNTNAPAIMIGEKGADLIRGRTLYPA